MDSTTNFSKTHQLSDGTSIPTVGLGTFKLQSKESLVASVMEVGYVHLDTATVYENEECIGEALQECFAQGKKREDLYITTKIWHKAYGDVEGQIRKSLAALKVDYVDLYLIHWPMGYYAEPKKPLHVLWAEMEALVAKGLTKSIGVSNFNTQLLWDLLTYAKIPPVVNQIEINPQNTNLELVRFCLAKNIRPVAYTPVGRIGWKDGPADWRDPGTDEFLLSLAKKYDRSVVQIMLNWHLCKGHVVIPKASSVPHQKQNLDIFDFRLTDEEILGVEKLNKGIRFCNNFEFFEKFDCFA